MIDGAEARIELLEQFLRYCPETGVFRWRVDRYRVKKGDAAGFDRNGYTYIRILRKDYPAHRLAWAFVHRLMPPEHMVIDHINGDPSDNRISNLRLADHAENLWNRGATRRNRSGVKGVSWSKTKGKWRADICANGKRMFLGYFTSKEAAADAYRSGAERYHGSFSNAPPAS